MASSTMRLSGLISGMDTESIIQQLVSAKQTKVDDAKKAQTKQEWKQTAWKELNTKIKNLQSKFVNNMRFESAYSKRVTKVSDSNAVSVITGDGAMTGVQNLKVSQLAKTAYMTGGKLTLKDNVTADTKLNALTKLSDLGIKGSDGSTVAGITTGLVVPLQFPGLHLAHGLDRKIEDDGLFDPLVDFPFAFGRVDGLRRAQLSFVH